VESDAWQDCRDRDSPFDGVGRIYCLEKLARALKDDDSNMACEHDGKSDRKINPAEYPQNFRWSPSHANTARTDAPVPLNSHSPLTLPGMRSTSAHLGQPSV
jgi:hypothetical protein